jgi:hypothetical protein
MDHDAAGTGLTTDAEGNIELVGHFERYIDLERARSCLLSKRRPREWPRREHYLLVGRPRRRRARQCNADAVIALPASR